MSNVKILEKEKHHKIEVGDIVEILGDDFARIIWKDIKEKLFFPYLKIDLITFDLSSSNRMATDDAITKDAAIAITKYRVGVKCPTSVLKEDGKDFKLLKLMNPDKTIRRLIGKQRGCTLFYETAVCGNFLKWNLNWKEPITLACHAQYDQYDVSQLDVQLPGRLEMIFTPTHGDEQRILVNDFASKGVAMVMYNLDESIRDFAECCFQFSLEKQKDLHLTTRCNILNIYDTLYKKIFEDVYEKNFQAAFLKNNLSYKHCLVDEMINKVMRCEDGLIWCCKNYDRNIISSIICHGFGDETFVTTTLKSFDGQIFLCEPYITSLPDELKLYKAGKETSVNSLGMIFSWTKALAYKALIDNNVKLTRFCENLERSCIDVIDSGLYTKNIAEKVKGGQLLKRKDWLDTFEFIDTIAERIKEFDF